MSGIPFRVVGCLVFGALAVSGQVRIDATEAEAMLAIVDGQDAWGRLFGSEGYQRLKKREAERAGAFTDEDFRKFAGTEALRQRRAALGATLAEWKQADLEGIGKKIRSYLPREATLRATVYIVIKPRTNSFVFELATNPAIFLYLDPEVTREKFENTVAHELHHVGLASVSRQEEKWLGAFGEGLAMLAAAGGPEVHPHLHSVAADRARWDGDMKNFTRDLREVERFLLDWKTGKLGEKEELEKAMAFYGEQGPWYTVGWEMAVTVERGKGRAALIGCMRDMRKLLRLYNESAGAGQAKWSAELLRVLGRPVE